MQITVEWVCLPEPACQWFPPPPPIPRFFTSEILPWDPFLKVDYELGAGRCLLMAFIWCHCGIPYLTEIFCCILKKKIFPSQEFYSPCSYHLSSFPTHLLSTMCVLCLSGPWTGECWLSFLCTNRFCDGKLNAHEGPLIQPMQHHHFLSARTQ